MIIQLVQLAKCTVSTMSTSKQSPIKRKRTNEDMDTVHYHDDFKEPSEKKRMITSELEDRSQCQTEKFVDPIIERQRFIVHSYIHQVIDACHIHQEFPQDLIEICLSFYLEECLFPSLIDSDDLVSSSDGISRISPTWNSISYSPIPQTNNNSPFLWIQRK